MSAADAVKPPEIRLTEPLPAIFAVGRGQYQLVRGKIFCAGLSVKALLINQPAERNCRVETFQGQEPDTFEFFISILWLPEDVGQQQELLITLLSAEQKQTVFALGCVELVDTYKTDVQAGSTIGDSPLIAICLASYNPAANRIARQIESILCQSYKNWLLIISDDHSDDINWGELEALCKLDPRRIRLYRHDQKLGFYHNFERALNYLPDNAELIAFSDQDDEWYPEKLQRLAEELERQPEAALAYSDMRIVSESGEVISNSYWQNRNNQYRDFSAVFIANTVTGAASLFKRELLEVLLPFPARIDGSFHDHWLACCAMSTAKLAYVADPLYDYFQYRNSVIGLCDFTPTPLSSRVGNTLMSHGEGGDTSARKWEKVYRHDCLRLQLIANTLKTRLPALSGNLTLNLMNGGKRSAFKLAIVYLKNRLMRRTTNDAELALAMGFLLGHDSGEIPERLIKGENAAANES